jgi:hypothetical protein
MSNMLRPTSVSPAAKSPYDNFELPFSMSSSTPVPSLLEDAVEGVRRSLHVDRSPIFDSFFSVTNIDVLQNRVRAVIQDKSGLAIDRQSDSDLVLIMRGIFAGSADVGSPVAGEVARLNEMVLSVVIPMVASGVASYLSYLRDANRVPEPLVRGQRTSTKGINTFDMFRGLGPT